MSHARTQAGRARVLGAVLVGVWVVGAGALVGPTEAAAAPARARAVRRTAVPLVVVGERETDGPLRDVVVSAQRIDEPAPVIELAVAEGEPSSRTAVIELEPGVWSLIARAPGRVDRQQVFTLPVLPRGATVAPVGFTLPLRRVPVTVSLGPPEAIAAGMTVTLARAGSEFGEMFAGERAREQLSLQPGEWRGSAAAPGFVTQEFTWTVEPGSGAPLLMSIALQPVAAAPVVAPPRPPAPAQKDPRLGLGLGLGVGGAVALGLGVGLLVQHRESYAHFMGAPNNDGFVATLAASSAGAGLVGGGLGLGVAGLTAGLGHAKDRVLWAELAVGGGLALIGAAWYAREWQDVQKDLYDANKDPEMDGTPNGHDLKSQRRETVASSILGAGAGLMVGAGVALLTRTIVRLRGRKVGVGSAGRSRWALAGGPGQVGLGLRGRF